MGVCSSTSIPKYATSPQLMNKAAKTAHQKNSAKGLITYKQIQGSEHPTSSLKSEERSTKQYSYSTQVFTYELNYSDCKQVVPSTVAQSDPQYCLEVGGIVYNVPTLLDPSTESTIGRRRRPIGQRIEAQITEQSVNKYICEPLRATRHIPINQPRSHSIYKQARN